MITYKLPFSFSKREITRDYNWEINLPFTNRICFKSKELLFNMLEIDQGKKKKTKKLIKNIGKRITAKNILHHDFFNQIGET